MVVLTKIVKTVYVYCYIEKLKGIIPVKVFA